MSMQGQRDEPANAAWVATIVLVFVIGYVTLAPIHNPGVPGSDKSRHFIAFASLALPLSLARPRLAPWVVLAAA